MAKGRPKKAAASRRDELLNVKVTAREKNFFQEIADHTCEGNLSFWIRTTLRDAAMAQWAEIKKDEPYEDDD